MGIRHEWKRSVADGLMLLAMLAAAEWLRAPAAGRVAVVGFLGFLLAALQLRGGTAGPAASSARRWGPALAALALAATLAVAQRQLIRVGSDWAGERERRIAAAFQLLSGELRAALRSADQLSERAASLADGDQAHAFATLDRDLPRNGPETAVVVLEPTGVPWAWAGRHRLPPEPAGDSIAARFTRFYAVLESRRHSAGGRVAVATVLVWADSAVPRPDRSLAARFGEAVGVQLRVYPPGAAPRGQDIFDYTEPTTQGDRLLFSAQPVPPDQAVVEAAVQERVSSWVGLALLTLAVVGLLLARAGPERFVFLAVLLWVVLRSPLGAAVGLDDLFSPATFMRTALRPVTGSAGALLCTSTLVLLLAVWLWSKRMARRPLGVALGCLLLISAPYLVTELGRGINPPLRGVSIGLWVSWQVTLTIATSALIALAAALFRGSGDPGDRPGRIVLGAAIAVTAAVVGLVLWEPRVGWPGWYPFLWVPALFLVALPGPRGAAIVGAAIVAGSAAALVTWGAELNGRIRAAQLDLAQLGDVEDPLAEPYLERFADQIQASPEPASGAELFVAWRSSYLAGQDYPVRLALWEPDGVRRAEIALDSLDLPASLLATLVRSFDSTASRSVLSVFRVPGRHYILLQRLPSRRILTAAVGPRSRLMLPTRLARLLRPPPEGPPLYELSLSPPFTRGMAQPPPPRWSREGTEARIDRLFDLPGGSRHVRASIQLHPLPLLITRGALLVSLDVLLLVVIWSVAMLRVDVARRWLAIRRLGRSFQLRLMLALALFFIVPAAGFTAWGLSRLEMERIRTRDLLITSVLRDAVLAAGSLLQEPSDYLAEGLGDLSNRFEADLVLYSGGRLVAASAPILEDLSLVEPLVDARVFQRLTLGDELELTRQATTYVAPVRVGYRVAQAGPPGGIGILATPQLTTDWNRTQDQQDLEFVLLFATVAGLIAAVLAARRAASALSRPVADLGRSAVAVGQGEPLPAVREPPVEFEQVFNAFGRMAGDIQASQAALESARQRTAAVLANVATGVVALDVEGRVLLANARARQLLDAPLSEGEPLIASLGPAWTPLVGAVDQFREGQESDAASEIQVNGRTCRVQLARLGRSPGGLVLAVDDVTDLTQAARVLAWGEMARQVAHEIKNPLTPIRLGVQHLRRVHRERPEQFDQVLEDTSSRILAEIDRLDTIARAFSRFGLPAGEQDRLEEVDLVDVAREVATLYRLGADGVALDIVAEAAGRRPARRDELKEVLGNLVENARNAGARRIVVRVSKTGFAVEDDGRGIPAEMLPRIFEPRFSTTTSGSGLGLPIVRRLVEGWGARVEVLSALGRGTSVTVRW